MSKQFSYQKGFRKGYQKGYQKGFDDGIKIGKSLFEPKSPEVNKKCEPEQLNDITTRPGKKKTCLNCDFYKKYLAGVKCTLVMRLVNGVKINRTK